MLDTVLKQIYVAANLQEGQIYSNFDAVLQQYVVHILNKSKHVGFTWDHVYIFPCGIRASLIGKLLIGKFFYICGLILKWYLLNIWHSE